MYFVVAVSARACLTRTISADATATPLTRIGRCQRVCWLQSRYGDRGRPGLIVHRAATRTCWRLWATHPRAGPVQSIRLPDRYSDLVPP